MTKRSPSQYNWKKCDFNELLMKLHYTKGRNGKIKFIVVHHMTIVGNDKGSACKACYRVWQTRAASAHYGVDGDFVYQYVWDKDFAWAVGDTYGNNNGISIEHANSTRRGWKISRKTWKNGARLVAGLHNLYGLGRPSSRTIKQHSDFMATGCPGPYMKKIFKKYIREAQKQYDILNGKKTKTYRKPKSKALNKLSSTSYPSRSYPSRHSHGSHITWLGKRLVAHGFGRYYKVGPGSNFTSADKKNIAAFQRAQGWSGSGADGYPGPMTLKRLAASPKKKYKKKPKPKAKTLNKLSSSSYPSRSHQTRNNHGSQITWLGKRLVAHGFGGHYKVGPGSNFTSADKKNVAAFQRAQGWKGAGADGYPGPKTLKRLAAAPKKAKKKHKSGTGTYIVNTKRAPLNGRSGPGTKYRKTMIAYKGAKLNIRKISGGWGKSSGGHWYAMKYLKKV